MTWTRETGGEPPGRVRNRALRVAYTIQNVGGIDFSQDVGDTVPVRQTLLGLRRADHKVTCFMLHKLDVLAYEDVSDMRRGKSLAQGLSGSSVFRVLERTVRRTQGVAGLPYFAAFDSFRFYEACVRALPAFDLCHEHNGLFSAGAALACKRLGMPYVLTVSADPLFERAMMGHPMRGVHGFVAAREAAFTYQMARRIVCVSRSAKENLVRAWKLDPQKVVVMPNGVDTTLFSPEYDPRPARRRWRLEDRPVVAFAGGFQPWHGLDRLIESMVIVRKHVPRATLLLIGDGRARSLVEQAITNNNLQEGVIVTGMVPQREVPALLATADVAVLPYPDLPAELWFSPLKMYEYMAAGKAIVATRAGQIAAVLEDKKTGLLVRPGDVRELAEAITRLLQDRALRQQLGRAARRQAVACHSWDGYLRRLEGVYDEALRTQA